ncbi:PTS sugar transporter subunit IIA [Streptomyces sp. NPDC007984]|uniref:PTS sugar transporter subunit IIA n=1 Tax=Streptomyces sp. NPDC007984 TaxID=3364801 RepID=UPI0036E13104
MSEQTSLLGLLPEEAVLVDVHAGDWRSAIRLAGEGLILGGAATADYTDEMIATVEQLGPYIVIAPGLALAHSRPSSAVRRTGLSWVSLRTPVSFGHQENDPVRLVVGLAATDHTQHTAALGSLAQLLGDPARTDELTAAPDAATVRHLISKFGKSDHIDPEVTS